MTRSRARQQDKLAFYRAYIRAQWKEFWHSEDWSKYKEWVREGETWLAPDVAPPVRHIALSREDRRVWHRLK